MIDDYSIYKFSIKDYIIVILLTVIISLAVAELFYKKFIIAIFLLPLYFVISKKYRHKKLKQRTEQLGIQFKDALQSISSALEAGYSIENAIKYAVADLEMMYEGKAYIITELRRITAMITNNTPIEVAIDQFAQRAQLEDIICFSEVFQSAKRSGGDMVSIIKHTSKSISEKIEISHSIDTMITARKLEVSIMKVMPFGILVYLTVCSDGFLDPLYGSIFGTCIMTIMLLLIIGISFIADKIMDIEV
ncbi:MAG: hypothetical protein PUC65_10305 [Clostridiales bacterium]|nr:hypothetical protein [Clostridiales bacterium]